MASLLMPKATAVWLVDNTGLTFDQIAVFCTLHPLEVQGIADGDVATGIMGVNPTQNGQLTKEEIEKAEADSDYRLKLADAKVIVPEQKRRGPRYTPISRRNERPNAIKWLVRNHPELKDAQIIRLVGTTKTTIAAVREGTHWNNANLTMMDPVTLGLCTQIDMDLEVKRANKGNEPAEAPQEGVRLMTAEEALNTAANLQQAGFAPDTETDPSAPEAEPTADDVFGTSEKIDAESVFSSLKSLKSDGK